MYKIEKPDDSDSNQSFSGSLGCGVPSCTQDFANYNYSRSVVSRRGNRCAHSSRTVHCRRSLSGCRKQSTSRTSSQLNQERQRDRERETETETERFVLTVESSCCRCGASVMVGTVDISFLFSQVLSNDLAHNELWWKCGRIGLIFVCVGRMLSCLEKCSAGIQRSSGLNHL